MKIEELQRSLAHFTGTENFWRSGSWFFKYTDGVKSLADKANCYWLLDVISSYRRTEPFQIWTLRVNEDKTARITMKEDDDRKEKVEQDIEYTDFPVGEISLLLVGNTLMLPSEY